MVINEFAYYRGKLWCAYELKDWQGNYKEDYRLEMRKESQRNMFRCPDCGENLILCAGPIMEPFFKHHDNTECIARTITASGRNMIARRMLYHLIKRSFPDTILEYSKRFAPKVMADFYMQSGEERLAIIYLSHEIKLAEWEFLHQYYLEQGITDIYFLNYKRYLHEVGTTFEYLISKADPVIKLLNYDENTLIMKVKPREKDSARLLSKTVSMTEVRIDLQGNIVVNGWDKECAVDKAMVEEQETREQQEREQQKQQVELQRELRKRQFAIEERKQESTRKRMESDNPVLYSSRFPIDDGKWVLRSSVAEGVVTKSTMKMTSIDELWDLPELEGKDWQVRNGNMNRYNYLKNVNRELDMVQGGEQREMMIDHAITLLERNTQAVQWRSKI